MTRSAPRPRRGLSVLRAFLSSEASGGAVVIAAALLALVAANWPATAALYAGLVHHVLGPVLAPDLGAMTVHLWINDAAMALFFLLVGLEIKRELVDGQLAAWDRRRLPFIAAACGMVAPAATFLLVTRDLPALHRGWAVPAATDIAFAMGVMALLGRRVPPQLKLLLATVAIVDDMGAVAIIALAYTDALHLLPLAAAGALLAILFALNRRGVQMLWPYLLLGAALWLAVLRSGVHATVAGVLLAAVIPIRCSPGAPDDARSPLHRLERALHPWSAWVIVPLFAFVNAGVGVRGGAAAFTQPLVIAVAAGLFLGKQVGIFGGIRLAVRLGWARLPGGVSWWQVHGLALLAGIGFTMSLFIGGLAFADAPHLAEAVKLGVLAGSLLSAVTGLLVLALASRRRGDAA
ncbi:MAG: Na+/H+ antiporter NhaA [Sphingomonas taxi]|uniref:Na(+)/H(+) antiporter NhaA n=1 Tax=Sphingomonas taxi TaxID=1549858 RepID=A0A2W5R3T6_9SPHN|nr:MAG: Na+/H+ antiporter NhaA [Sphingomonas taxi]